MCLLFHITDLLTSFELITRPGKEWFKNVFLRLCNKYDIVVIFMSFDIYDMNLFAFFIVFTVVFVVLYSLDAISRYSILEGLYKVYNLLIKCLQRLCVLNGMSKK